MFDEEATKDNAMDAAEAEVKLTSDRKAIVQLDPDHPGFRDPEYRARRNAIAQIAVDYKLGERIPDAVYTEDEHKVWKIIREKLEPVHAKYACSEYQKYSKKLKLPDDRLPQLSKVSEQIKNFSGFQLEPTAGLVSPRAFLSVLAEDTFLTTQYIRHYSVPEYTPEPDIVHEIIGHGSMLASPSFAELNRMIGRAVQRTKSTRGIDFISRIFWYTIEFGILREANALKAYGAGLLSSAGELAAIEKAEIRPINFQEMGNLDYDVTHYQPVLFCAESFPVLIRQMHDFFSNWNDDPV